MTGPRPWPRLFCQLWTSRTNGMPSDFLEHQKSGQSTYLQRPCASSQRPNTLQGAFQADPQLEWSPAIIGLCTAIEAEIVSRILRPLSAKASGDDLAADKADKDIGRVAAFCSDATRKPPELGTFAHFLQTFIHSQHRRVASALFRSFTSLTADWIGSHWLLEPKGLHQALTTLTSEFRNRAAHIDELSKEDYAAAGT